jgi:isopenicillin-N epimerase
VVSSPNWPEGSLNARLTSLHTHRFRGGYEKVLDDLRPRIAAYISAPEEDVVFVENASSGINAFLRSLGLSAGDAVIELSIAYSMVQNTLEFMSQSDGVEVSVVEVQFPGAGQEPRGTEGLSLAETLAHTIEELQKAGKNVRIVSLSHIVSCPAFILPLVRAYLPLFIVYWLCTSVSLCA